MDFIFAGATDIYTGLMRFFHVIAGVAWIGLLYYFNFVQVPALKAAAADGTGAGTGAVVSGAWLTGSGPAR